MLKTNLVVIIKNSTDKKIFDKTEIIISLFSNDNNQKGSPKSLRVKHFGVDDTKHCHGGGIHTVVLPCLAGTTSWEVNHPSSS